MARIDRKDVPERVFDVVVFECGAAGMSAALAAKERGAGVIIVERQPRSRRRRTCMSARPYRMVARGGMRKAV